MFKSTGRWKELQVLGSTTSGFLLCYQLLAPVCIIKELCFGPVTAYKWNARLTEHASGTDCSLLMCDSSTPPRRDLGHFSSDIFQNIACSHAGHKSCIFHTQHLHSCIVFCTTFELMDELRLLLQTVWLLHVRHLRHSVELGYHCLNTFQGVPSRDSISCNFRVLQFGLQNVLIFFQQKKKARNKGD